MTTHSIKDHQYSFIYSIRSDARYLCRPCESRLSKVSTLIFNRGLKAIFLYRLSHLLYKYRIPLLPLLFSRIAQLLYSVDIDYRAVLGPGIVLIHCFGTVIGRATIIEGNCHIFHGVTLGDRGSEWVGDMIADGHPYIGKNCVLGAGAKLLGPINVGENCVIGANSVVTRDVPRNSVMAGIPAKRISERPLMDNHMRPIGGHRRNVR